MQNLAPYGHLPAGHSRPQNNQLMTQSKRIWSQTNAKGNTNGCPLEKGHQRLHNPNFPDFVKHNCFFQCSHLERKSCIVQEKRDVDRARLARLHASNKQQATLRLFLLSLSFSRPYQPTNSKV